MTAATITTRSMPASHFCGGCKTLFSLSPPPANSVQCQIILTCTSSSIFLASLLLRCIIAILMSNTTIQSTSLQGWTNSPDGRGAIDIVSCCIFMIFIRSWSVLCINIGAPGESTISQFLQKLKLALICILGPDFLLLLVFG